MLQRKGHREKPNVGFTLNHNLCSSLLQTTTTSTHQKSDQVCVWNTSASHLYAWRRCRIIEPNPSLALGLREMNIKQPLYTHT